MRRDAWPVECVETYASCEPSAFPRGFGPPHPADAVRWQVFGLAGASFGT